ncbi:MAG: hypothetical protein ACE5FH_07930 [Candidatus Zixiibacteriota bacterium]
MKINPVGIQSYQQLIGQKRATEQPREQTAQNEVARDLSISPQEQASRVAVKAPSRTYAEFLSTEERRALEILFDKFQDSGRFGPGYARGGATENDRERLGTILDVKA